MIIGCECGSCNTDVVISYHEYVYKGYVLQVEKKHTECWDCGLEFTTRFQTNYNDSQVSIAKFTIEQYILDNPEEE